MKPHRPITLIMLGLLSTFPEILRAEGESTSTMNSTTSENSTTTKIQELPPTSANRSRTLTDIPCTDSDNPCDLTDGLICAPEGLCKCAYPHLTFNKEEAKCFAKVGEQCGFFIGLRNASTVSCPESALCALINLELVSDGVNQYSVRQCACKYTHYRTEEGQCAPFGQLGETCDEKRKCSVEGELLCINSTCQCHLGEDQFYDPVLRTCTSYAGGNCTRSCVPNSLCDFWGTGTCQCSRDFRHNSDRHCEPIPPGYLAPCLGEKELCNRDIGLKCIDKVCQCANPLHQIYDFQSDRCIGLAGDLCDPDLPDNCISHAKCGKSDPGDPLSSCNCEEGYSTTPFRKCMKSRGMDCVNEFCNVYRGLACVNGTCGCYDSFLKYDEGTNACLSPVGSPCGKIFVPFPGDWVKASCPECDSYYFACDEGSSCSRDFSDGNEVGALEKFRCSAKTDTKPN